MTRNFRVGFMMVLTRIAHLDFKKGLARIACVGFKGHLTRMLQMDFILPMTRIVFMGFNQSLTRILLMGFKNSVTRTIYLGFRYILTRTTCMGFRNSMTRIIFRLLLLKVHLFLIVIFYTLSVFLYTSRNRGLLHKLHMLWNEPFTTSLSQSLQRTR